MHVRPWPEEELVPLSALEHFAYCPRQCALIHVEQVFDENVYTLRGRAIHEHVDEPGTEWVEGVRVERALPLWSRRLGLTGKADMVEFPGNVPYPVDYKHGPKGRAKFARFQLCGQALCLEEMFGEGVPKGAIYHFRSRCRSEIEFTAGLREDTLRLVEQIREMLTSALVPAPPNDARCPNCSLAGVCMPALAVRSRVRRTMEELFKAPVDVAPVPDPKDEDAHPPRLDDVDDPVPPDAIPPQVDRR
jgi:CRISPR-associated exonuclease Cas4